MSAFTMEERWSFKLKKYLKERALDFLLELIKNIMLVELVVWRCAGSGYLQGAIMALGYTVGWAVYDVYHYKKEWVDVDIRPDGTEN